MKAYYRPDNKTVDHLMSPQEYLASTKRMLFLYGEIAPIYYDDMLLKGPSWMKGYSAHYIADSIMAMDLEDSAKPIILVISSPGGWIEVGLALYDTIKMVESPVCTIGRNCQSLAVVLLSAGMIGHRYVLPNSRMMLHLPSGSMSGDSEQIAIRSREMQEIKHILVKLLKDNGAKRSPEEILKDIDREYWMSAQEVVDYGIADRIMEYKQWKDICSIG